MVIQDTYTDTISIDLSEVFGKVINISARDAERMQTPVLTLAITEDDYPAFRDVCDRVVARLMSRMEHIFTDNNIVIDWPILNIEIKRELIKLTGLHIIDKAVEDAITYAVMEDLQAGLAGYEGIRQLNIERYEKALSSVAVAASFRGNTKISIKHRAL